MCFSCGAERPLAATKEVSENAAKLEDSDLRYARF